MLQFRKITFKYLEAIWVISLFFLVSVFYFHDIFHNWFVYDDAATIWYATESLREIFIENKYSSTFYTPLAALSLKPDFLIFGLNPVPYHLHNFIILVLIAFILYKILSLYTNKINSFVPVLFILFSLPSLVMVSWITLRQYLYPTLFSLIAIHLFIKYRPNIKDSKLLIFVILVLIELSFMGKEQFMTLPFVLFILSNGNLRKRISNTFPYFILLISHFLFRAYILKGISGSYIGMLFNFKTYIITIFKSLFIASRVAYGYELIFLIIISPLLIFSLRKSLGLFLIWIFSLGIQFLKMAEYPDVFSLRYWFIPVVLLSLMVSLGAESIKNNFARWVYILLITIFFLLNISHNNKEVKSFLKQESLLAKSVSLAMIDKKYSGGLILIPEDFTLMGTGYLRTMDRIFREKLDFKTYPTFIPIDFLIFYPQFKDNNRIYGIKYNQIFDISDSINERMNDYKNSFLDIIPTIESARGGSVVKITCNTPSKNFIAYIINKFSDDNEKLFYNKAVLSYIEGEEINVKLLFKKKYTEIIAREKIFFDGKKLWLVNDKELKAPSEALVMFSCITSDNKITFPSDIIFLKD